jgi:hypothetical protein
MAKYYGVLPSVIVSQASTFDLMVYDVSLSWEQYQQDKAAGKNTIPELSQAELMKILKESKGG